MTNTTTNYSYDTIPGNVEEAAPKKDENIRRMKKVGVLASCVLGFLCLAFFVVGRYSSHQYRTSVDTTAASSSIVSFLPLNSANRVPNCQELCAARPPVEFCINFRQSIFDLCTEDEPVCVEECSSAAMFSCDNIRETTYELCLLWNCLESAYTNPAILARCIYNEEDDCRTEANTVYAQQHCTNRPTVAPTPAPPTPAPVPLPAGSKCSSTAECAIPTGLTHGVCRDGRCQSGESGSSCGVTSDCVKPTGLDHPVCRDGRCQNGAPGASCGVTSDCAIPSGLTHAVCHDGTCKSGAPGSYCGVTSDCVKPTGLSHPVCRDGRCQSGDSGSSCGQTSDCVVPQGLEHPVCRKGKCQSGA